MYVVVAKFRNVVIHDVRQAGDVDAPPHHIGGHEHLHGTFAKLLHHPIAHALRQVAVDARNLFGVACTAAAPPPRQPFENFVGAALRTAKHDHLPRVFPVEQFLEKIELARGIDREIELLDRLDRDFTRRKVEDLGIAHVARGDRLHRGRNRGREQERLPAVRAAA